MEPNTRGFVRVSRSWQLGDTVRLHFPMIPVVRTGRDESSGTHLEVAHRATPVTIRENNNMRGVPYASISYGPLLFALPIPDTTDANTPDPAAQWKYALDVQDPGLTVERYAMPSRWDWPLAAPLKLRVNAIPIEWQPDPKAPLLPPLPAEKAKGQESVTLVPYGCTKFRISMFPVTAVPEVEVSAIRKILFLGNSITLHGPNADIGWSGNWGMAASSQDKDYAHLLTSDLAHRTGSTPEILVRNIADFERNYASYDVHAQMEELFAFDADLVVLAIGENAPPLGSEEAKSQFKAGVLKILRFALARRHPLVVVRSCFWADPAKDELLSQACQEVNGIWVNAGESDGTQPMWPVRNGRLHTTALLATQATKECKRWPTRWCRRFCRTVANRNPPRRYCA